jgi:hypothetical protein
MEERILRFLNFHVSVPTASVFLARYLKIAGGSRYTTHRAHYFAERSLREHDMRKYKPSVVAAAAHLPGAPSRDARRMGENRGLSAPCLGVTYIYTTLGTCLTRGPGRGAPQGGWYRNSPQAVVRSRPPGCCGVHLDDPGPLDQGFEGTLIRALKCRDAGQTRDNSCCRACLLCASAGALVCETGGTGGVVVVIIIIIIIINILVERSSSVRVSHGADA